MKDGEHRECPIVETVGFRLQIDEEDFLIVSASHDTVEVFPDSRFNHLRYYDANDRRMKLVWLAKDILAELVDRGIPTSRRESITEEEVDCYHTFLAQTALQGVGEDIDIQVAKETEHLAEELDYYLDEWLK